MAKYKHHPDTLIVLNDIKNKLQQLIESNSLYKGVGHDDKIRYVHNRPLIICETHGNSTNNNPPAPWMCNGRPGCSIKVTTECFDRIKKTWVSPTPVKGDQ